MFHKTNLYFKFRTWYCLILHLNIYITIPGIKFNLYQGENNNKIKQVKKVL